MIDTLKTIGISVVVVIVALLLTGSFTATPSVGGTYEITKQSFSGGLVAAEFVQGGGCKALVDADGGTYTLSAQEMDNNNCFSFSAGGAGQAVVALQLPTATQLQLVLPNIGDSRDWVYDASALAAATTTTITAGTGIDLIAYTTNDDVIDGAEYAQLTCWRKSTTAVGCFTTEMLNAD